MIDVTRYWLYTAPMDMRYGIDTFMQLVIKELGAVQLNEAYLFINRRQNRLKALIHDGQGIWLANRRLHQGEFKLKERSSDGLHLSAQQAQALLQGLPWYHYEPIGLS